MIRTCFSLFLFSLLFSATPAFSATYTLKETITGPSFYNAFEFQAIPDPTNGRVNYVDQRTAQRKNLTFATHNSFILRADYKTTLDPNGPGRNSVRIQTKKSYTRHVAVFDIRHMPQGCGTWPALWATTASGWPVGGEIDIIEGVNDQSPNQATLHTTAGCSMPYSRWQTGTSGQLNCDVSVNSNAGCGVKFPTANSYGPAFNKVGGGWYAMERSTSYVRVWFWARNDPTVPLEVKNGVKNIETKNWKTPTALFPNTSCDLTSHLTAHRIIINLTLCGDWAGNAYPQAGCPSTCVDFVNSNPAAFKNAYFDIASMRTYA